MATIISFTNVVAGNKALASDINNMQSTLTTFLNAIDGGNVSAGTLPGTAITTNSIPGTAILDLAITTGKLANNAVTAAKMANATITATQIANGTITNTQISATAAIALSKLAAGSCRIAIGTYTGDGTASQSIAGLAFTPTVVMIGSTTNTHYPTLRTSGHTGTNATVLATGAVAADCIASLDPTGFTTGNSLAVNQNTHVYWYICLAANA